MLDEVENAPDVSPDVASLEKLEGAGVGGRGAGVDGGDGRGGSGTAAAGVCGWAEDLEGFDFAVGGFLDFLLRRRTCGGGSLNMYGFGGGRDRFRGEEGRDSSDETRNSPGNIRSVQSSGLVVSRIGTFRCWLE